MTSAQNKSCVTLNSLKNTTEWAVNSTADPLDVAAFLYPPFLVYTEWESTEDNSSLLYYQFCGPLIVLLRTFAKHINTDVLLRSIPRDWVSWNNDALYYLGYITELPALFLFPSVLTGFTQDFLENTDNEFTFSRYIGGMEGGVIVSKTKFINRPVFEFLDCWDHSLYVGLFVSIFAMSCVCGLIEGSFLNIFNNMWYFSSIILSDAFEFVHKCLKTRILAAIWLLVNTLMLTIYSGQLYEFIIRGQIIDTINNREELYTKDYWKHSDIYTIDNYLISYVFEELLAKNPMALHLANRIVSPTNGLDLYFDNTLRKNFFIDVMTNKAVLVGYKMCVYYYLRKGQKDWPNFIEGLDFTVSETEDFLVYNLAINRRVFPDSLIESFNEIISRLQESGIHDYEVLMSVTGAVGEDPNTKHDIPIEYIIRNMVFVDVQGVFLFLLTGCSLSLIMIFGEIIFKLFFDFEYE